MGTTCMQDLQMELSGASASDGDGVVIPSHLGVGFLRGRGAGESGDIDSVTSRMNI